MSYEQLKAVLDTARVTKNNRLMAGWELRLDEVLRRQVEVATSFLGEGVALRERLLNIRLNRTTLPRCERCADSLVGKIWKAKLDYPRFCSPKCRHAHVTTKRVQTLLSLQPDGDTIAKKIGRKVAQKQALVGPDGLTGAQRRIKKSILTKAEKGQVRYPAERTEFERYKLEVRRITKQQPIHLLENYDKRGGATGWHLDHKYSILQGFIDKIPPAVIGHISNLRIIPARDNVQKSHQCSVTIDELIAKAQNALNGDDIYF